MISKYLKAGGALMPKKKKEECNSASAQPQLLRGKKKESMQESAALRTSKTVDIRTRFREATSSSKGTKFKVILIQEGLGNFRSAFYYTKECLQSAAALFEGKKCYADHPSSIEEQSRPERSTRDILGYFEGVAYVEDGEGRGMLEANLCLEATQDAEWARSLLTNSIEYAKKYTDKDFVGLSINASGEAEPKGIDDFLKSSGIPEAAIPKLLEAKNMGVDQVQVVKSLKDAVSCDLVTEAGAGGKILSMIESKRGKEMKQKQSDEKKVPSDPGKTGPMPMKKEEAAPEAAPAKDGEGHTDADQDKALFAKMIKQYLGEEAEESEENMKMAKHAYEAHKEDGMEAEEAYEAAGKHLKMAMAIGKKMAPADEQKEAKEEECKKEDGEAKEAKEDEAKEAEEKKEEAKKESSSISCRGCIEKSAQLSKLKESLRVIELQEYLEKKCADSKLPVAITKEARSVLGTPKSKKDIDFVLETFKKAHQGKTVEAATTDSWFMPEKTQLVESASKGKLGSLSDCINI